MSMIEYTPPGLKSILNDPHAGKRLRNREGVAYVTDPDGNFLQNSPEEIRLVLQVYQWALNYQALFPAHNIEIVEERCGGIMGWAPPRTTL